MVKKRAICTNCLREMLIHAKGMCMTCYKKLAWKPKKQECKRCHRMMIHQAHGYCKGCYNYIFHIDNIKAWNYEKRHNIPAELYLKLTKSCLICGFSKYVVLHHLDENHSNSDEKNLIGLCPNHHQLVHTIQFKEEVQAKIRKALQEQELPLPSLEITEAPKNQIYEIPIKQTILVG